MKKRFAFVGKIRSGKTTVADIVGSYLGNYKKIEFSDSLREATDIMYPETRHRKDREKLIAVGQHMRKLDMDIWVKCVEKKIIECEEWFGEDYPIMVSSVRQPNEVEMLKKRGFTIIRVNADEEARIQRCITAGDVFNLESFTDYTETALDDYEFDIEISNNGSDLGKLKMEVISRIDNQRESASIKAFLEDK